MTRRLLIYDAATKDVASCFWGVGAVWMASNYNMIIAASSVDDVIEKLKHNHDAFDEIQIWGHGSPGYIYIDMVPLLQNFWDELKRHCKKDAYVWLRTCSFACGSLGKENTANLANFLDCNVLAHTFSIGQLGFQSGLKTVSPSRPPKWHPSEGVSVDGAAIGSTPWRPQTTHALVWNIPSWAR